MERNLTPPPTRPWVDFLRIFFSKSSIPYIVSDKNHCELWFSKTFELFGFFRDFFERFGASNWRKSYVFWKNWILDASKNTSINSKVFRGAAWNPIFAEITQIAKMRNKIALPLRILFLLKFQVFENKCMGIRRSGRGICGWDLSVRCTISPIWSNHNYEWFWSETI